MSIVRPPSRCETPAGMVNSIGLPNKGLDGFCEHDLPELSRLPVPLCVSVMAPSRDGFGALVQGIGGRDEVAAIELNVSCPNVKTGLDIGADPASLAPVMDAVRPRTDKPLIVKLTPNCASPAAVAATIARRREARAARVLVRDRTGQPRELDAAEDPVAKALIEAAEDLISASQRGSDA